MTEPRLSPSQRRALTYGCGISAGVSVAVLGGLAALVAVLASSLQGCDLNLGDPGDGTRSAHLAVGITPRTGIAPGQRVRVTSRAFAADTIVSVTVCLSEADTDHDGKAACDMVQGTRFATDHRGRLDATYTVPRRIRVHHTVHDCGVAAARCLVVAADASDFDRSGGQRISFRPGTGLGDAPPTERPSSFDLPVLAAPNGPVAPGTPVKVAAAGFQPGEPVLVAWCPLPLRSSLATDCEARDPGLAISAVLRTLPTEGLRADDHGRVIVTVPARRDVLGTYDHLSDALATTSSIDGPYVERRTAAIDCRAAPGRCAIVIAAAADLARSAVSPYTLAG